MIGEILYDRGGRYALPAEAFREGGNLPKQVTKSTNDYIKYTYDAGGRKMKQEVFNASNQRQKWTEYDGEYVYEGDTLKFINTEEGRVVMTGATPEYQYS
ncbi:MAG: hypothetical protein WDN75_05180 [Bacteroidota bacterium]